MRRILYIPGFIALVFIGLIFLNDWIDLRIDLRHIAEWKAKAGFKSAERTQPIALPETIIAARLRKTDAIRHMIALEDSKYNAAQAALIVLHAEYGETPSTQRPAPQWSPDDMKDIMKAQKPFYVVDSGREVVLEFYPIKNW